MNNEYKIANSALSAFKDGIIDGLNRVGKNIRINDYKSNWYYYYDQGLNCANTLDGQKMEKK